jgi:hypothetical protein
MFQELDVIVCQQFSPRQGFIALPFLFSLSLRFAPSAARPTDAGARHGGRRRRGIL